MSNRDDRVSPPAYEDVVRSTRYPVLRSSIAAPHGSGSVPGGSTPTPWKLKFVDFTPHLPTSSGSKRSPTDFYELVDRANLWLSTNKDCEIRSCETVTWLSNVQSRLNDTDLVNMSIKHSAKTYHMRGLRLWLAPKVTSGGEDTVTDTIGVRDFEPDFADDNQKDQATFLKVLNNRIQEDPIRGTIINMNTVLRRTCPNVKAKDTYWTDSESGSRSYGYFFRVFFICGSPCRDRLEVKDFCPEKQATSRQKFDDYDSVVCRANAWLANQSELNIINIQSVMLKKKDSFRMAAEKMFFTAHASKSALFLQCLRIVYVKPRDVVIPLEQPLGTSSLFVLKKTFAPLRKAYYEGRNEEPDELKYERLTKTVEQVSKWLASTGSDLFQVETITVRQGVVAGRPGPGPDTPFVHLNYRNPDEWVVYVRCYVVGDPTNNQSEAQTNMRYIHLPSIGQRWYTRNSSSNQQLSPARSSRSRLWMAVGVTLFVTSFVVAGFVVAYFLYFKNLFTED